MNDKPNIEVEKLKPFTKFIYTLGQLPSSYLASMSYEEQLIWLCNYLAQTVIPTVNNNGAAVTELQNLFTELQDYVNEYFDNLDVQEEIDTKLDEMALDGTLTNLIKGYVDPIYQEYENQINSEIETQNNAFNLYKQSVNNELNGMNTNIENQNEEIESFKDDVNTEIAEITEIAQSATSGSPKGVYATVDALETADPNHDYIYVVTATGKWYYYSTTNSAWEEGGAYQSTGIADGSIAEEMLNDNLKSFINYSFPEYTTTDNYYIYKTGTKSPANNYSYSSPIPIKHNESISLIAKGAGTNLAVISMCDSEGGNINPVVISIDSDVHTYSYTSPIDGYVIVSSRKAELSSVMLYNHNVTKSDYDHLDQKIETNNAIDILTDSDFTVSNKYVNINNGNIYDHVRFNCTDFIKIKQNSHFKLQCLGTLDNEPASAGIAFYDINKVYLSGIALPDSTYLEGVTPKNAYYMRASRKFEYSFYNYMYYTQNKDIINNEIPLKELYKSFLHVGVIGDSMASGESAYHDGGTVKYIDIYEQSWPQYMARNSGNTYYNFTKGGLTTKTWLTDEHGYPLASDGNHACEGYIIGLGLNDVNYYGSAYLGSSDDIHEDYHDNADTFYGNYAGIIQRMKALYPKAKFFLLTMPKTGTNETFNTAIEYIADLFDNCYLIDLHAIIDVFNLGFINANKRSGHLNAIGYNYVADIIANEINKIMNNNISEFNEIEFINTNYEW